MQINERKLDLWKSMVSVDADTKAKLLTLLKNACAAYEKVLTAKVDAALSRIRNGKDGRDGKDGKDGRNGKDGEDGMPGRDGEDGSPDNAQTILKKLLSIDVPWLTKKDRKDLEALIKKAGEEKRTLSFGAAGGGRGFYVYIDGIKKGIIKELNFVGGTGMAIAYSAVLGRPTLTFNASGSGSGVSVETPAESPDASRTTFTVSAQPQWVVADGTTYFEGQGYSYSALVITMDIPPSASVRVII